MYGQLRDTLGHFPLKHFWGPLANIQSTAWIVASAIWAAEQHRPNFFYIYLPHLDYAAQKFGPDSDAANTSLTELDTEIGKLRAGFEAAYEEPPLWLVASEYAISPVDHVTYPNRVLREAGLLKVQDTDEGEQLDIPGSLAFAMVDHQFSHVFIRDADATTISQVTALFRGQPGIAEVLTGEGLAKYKLNHERSGEVVLISEPNSWQAYYWWLDDARAHALPARSTSTASPATTRSSCSSIRRPRAFRSTPRSSAVRTVRPPPAPSNKAFCSLLKAGSSRIARIATPTWPLSFSRNSARERR